MFRNYDRIVLLCYPRGSGGNFLINCLSLTDQCVLRDSVLAEQQLDLQFGTQEKLDYLMTRLEESLSDNQWKDFDLGCGNLFGIDDLLYLQEYPEIIQTKFNSVVGRLIQKQKYLFLTAHSIHILKAELNFWVNAKVIFFSNYHNFKQQRAYDTVPLNNQDLSKITTYWNTVRDQQWPIDPPITADEFNQLPDYIQRELKQNFHGEIFKWLDHSKLYKDLYDRDVKYMCSQLGNRAYEWNVEKTFSGNFSIFFEELCKLSDWAGINITASSDNLSVFYHRWLHTVFGIHGTLFQPSN